MAVTVNIPIENAVTDGSLNPVTSNAVFDALAGKQASLGFTPENLANKQTDLTASATKYPTVDAVNTGLSGKQATLVSGTNIKTINSTTLLGSGDVVTSNLANSDLSLTTNGRRVDFLGNTTTQYLEFVNTSNLFCLKIWGDRTVTVGGTVTAAAGGFVAWNGTAIINANDIVFNNTLTTARFRASATTTNLAFRIGSTDYLTIETTGSQVLGSKAALATTATDGFLYIPTCAGTPTGVPTAITGKVPIIADTTNNKLYVYLGGAWVTMN